MNTATTDSCGALLNTTEEIIKDIRLGKMVILMDDEDRENEGDIIMAATHARAEDINFMARYARGLICLTLTEARCQQLGLPLMVAENHSSYSTNFTVSIEAANGVTTGISAADRARTIQAAVSSSAKPEDIVQPGHIFPVMAQQGGVLIRAGHTEAGCDLARLAGLDPSAVIVEIMNDDGSMARRPDLEAFAKEHSIKIGTIADLIQHRTVHEKTISCIREREVSTQWGCFTLKTYLDKARDERHFALVLGNLAEAESTLVRVHVGSVARDILGVVKGVTDDYKPWTVASAMQKIQAHGSGVLVLLCNHETSEDVEESIDWIISGQQRRPCRDLAFKQIGVGSQILQDLGVEKMRLMSAPYRFKAISGFNLEVVEYIENTE